MKFRIVVLSLSIGAFYFGTAAIAAPPCSGLTGEARKQCLNAEIERGNKELEKINKRNKRLDTAIKVACGTDKVIGAVASGAGHVAGGTAGSLAAKGTYAGARAAGNVATGGKSSCTKKAE